MLRPSKLGINVKELRGKIGLSIRELAGRADISHTTLSRLESGRIQEIGSFSLGMLADALNTTADALLNRTPPPYSYRLLNDVMAKVRLETLAVLDLDTVLDSMAEKFLVEGRFRSATISLVHPGEGIYEVVRNLNCIGPDGSDTPGRNIRTSSYWVREEVLENGEVMSVDDEQIIGRKTSIDAEDDLAAQAIRAKRLLVFDGYGKHCRPEPDIANRDTRRKLAYMIPLLYEDQVIGLIATGSSPDDHALSLKRRGEIYDRIPDDTLLQFWRAQWPDLGYAPRRVVDAPFRSGTLGAAFADDLQFAGLTDFLRRASGTFQQWEERVRSQNVDRLREEFLPNLSIDALLERLFQAILAMRCVEDLWQVLQALRDELDGLEIAAFRLNVILIDEQEERFENFCLWDTGNDCWRGSLRNLEQADEKRLINHWRRRELFARQPHPEWIAGEMEQGRLKSPYDVAWLIDVPFELGTIGVSLSERGDLPLHGILASIGRFLTLGLKRFR